MKGHEIMKKSVFALLLIAVVIITAFCGCAKLPEEPATTNVEKHSYINPMGATAPAPENVDEFPGAEIEPVYIETINNIEFVFSSYYVYGKNAASLKINKLNYDGFSLNPNGFVDVTAVTVGRRSDDMKIGYTAYDADGKVIRDSFILAKLDGVKAGDVIEGRRFDFPKETVKIVFHDYEISK